MGDYSKYIDEYHYPVGEKPLVKADPEYRRRVIDYIYNDMKKRSLDTILADILLDPEDYKKRLK